MSHDFAPVPYYADESVTLYHGDCRELLDGSGLTADAIVTDSMWCFGSLQMWIKHGWSEFVSCGWTMSQDVIWEKHNGSGFAADRFKRVHEQPVHWYGDKPWSEIYHETPTTPDATARQVRRKARPAHTGYVEASSYTSEDGGPRLMRSVIAVRSMHGRALHPTEKPVGILDPLIRYACPPGGTVLDCFAGSGSTAEAARLTGRKAILIEADERYCELIARRMSQGILT
jgi:site-specific DNA-methyltransferase (adenine-specific)